MNYKTWFLISVISLQIITCRPPVFKSRWMTVPIIIDGQITGRDSVAWYPVESPKVSLGLGNTDTDLFILLKSDHPMYTLRSNEIVLSFAGKEKEDVSVELHYSGTMMATESSEPKDSFWQCLNNDQRKRFMKEKNKLDNMITLIKNGHATRIPPDGTKGFAAAGIDQQDFNGVEFKIPIQGNEKLYGLDLAPGESCFIGIKFAAIKESIRPGMMDQMTDMTSGRSIMQEPPLQGRGGFRVKERSIENKEIWFKVILATQ